MAVFFSCFFGNWVGPKPWHPLKKKIVGIQKEDCFLNFVKPFCPLLWTFFALPVSFICFSAFSSLPLFLYLLTPSSIFNTSLTLNLISTFSSIVSFANGNAEDSGFSYEFKSFFPWFDNIFYHRRFYRFSSGMANTQVLNKKQQVNTALGLEGSHFEQFLKKTTMILILKISRTTLMNRKKKTKFKWNLVFAKGRWCERGESIWNNMILIC